MLMEGEGSVQGHAEIHGVFLVLKFLTLPGDFYLCLSLMVVQMESGDFGFSRIGIQKV